MTLSEHEKNLIDALRTIEDLKDFNAHHFGDKYVDEKLKNYGAFESSQVFSNSKFHKEYLDKDGNLVIENNDGKRVIAAPKDVDGKKQYEEFKKKMRQSSHTYSKRIEDDGKTRTIYINENGKETKYNEPSKFKFNDDHRAFFNNESTFKEHKTSKSSSYSREEHDDGETLTITEIIDGEKRVSTKPSKLKKVINSFNSNNHKSTHRRKHRKHHNTHRKHHNTHTKKHNIHRRKHRKHNRR